MIKRRISGLPKNFSDKVILRNRDSNNYILTYSVFIKGHIYEVNTLKEARHLLRINKII